MCLIVYAWRCAKSETNLNEKWLSLVWDASGTAFGSVGCFNELIKSGCYCGGFVILITTAPETKFEHTYIHTYLYGLSLSGCQMCNNCFLNLKRRRNKQSPTVTPTTEEKRQLLQPPSEIPPIDEENSPWRPRVIVKAQKANNRLQLCHLPQQYSTRCLHSPRTTSRNSYWWQQWLYWHRKWRSIEKTRGKNYTLWPKRKTAGRSHQKEIFKKKKKIKILYHFSC